jgi:hypothetical protein
LGVNVGRFRKSQILALLIFASSLPFSCNARAGVAFFVETCVAAVNDFTALETRLPALAMTEIYDMPSRVLRDPKSARTWLSYAFPGKPGDGFIQLAIGSDAQPFDVCSHASRPGENATEALAKLQALYPPAAGSVRREAELFYGGRETWAAEIDGVEVFFRVAWAFQNDPSNGTSVLNLIKPRLRGRTLPN